MADEKPAPGAPETPVAAPPPAKEETAAGSPKVGKIRPAGTSSRSRATDAGESSSSEPESTTTETGTSTSAAPSAAGDPKKPDASTETPGRRALTLALEKEAKLVEDQRAFKTERETWEAQRKADDADRQLLTNAREAVKGGKRLEALRLLGISLDEVQDEYLATMREPTTEDIVARTVEERLAAERKKDADAAAERAQADETKRSEDLNSRIATWKDGAEKAYREKAAELDPAAMDGVTADLVWERAHREFTATGKLPTQAEALALLEKDFLARVAKSKRFKPVEATPAPQPEGDSTERTARARTPRVPTSRDAGSVSLKPPSAQRKKTAFERLQEAKAEHGVD